MAFCTNRKHIQWLSIIWMMIMSTSVKSANCASLPIWLLKSSGFDCVINGTSGFNFLWIIAVLFLRVAFIGGLAIFAFFVYFMLKLDSVYIILVPKPAFLAFTRLTPRSDTKFATFLLVKVRDWLDGLATGTFFRYNWLIHCLFLQKRCWLWLVAGPIPVSSLSIVWPSLVFVKKNHKGFA